MTNEQEQAAVDFGKSCSDEVRGTDDDRFTIFLVWFWALRRRMRPPSRALSILLTRVFGGRFQYRCGATDRACVPKCEEHMLLQPDCHS